MERYFVAGALICAALAAFCLSRTAYERIRHERARGALREAGARGGASGGFERIARNGFRSFLPAARKLCGMRVVGRFVGNVSRWVETTRGVKCPPLSAASILLAALLAIGAAGSAITWNPIGGLAADALVVALLAMRVRALLDQELDELRDGVPAALGVMVECFSSGYSLMQTMGQVADQTEGRLSGVFAHCADVLKLGGTSREALECLRGEGSVPELAFVAVALDVQHQAGGSIAGILGNACRMVEDEIELRRSLRVQTAQARLSARVVCVMPFVLVAVLSLASEGFLSAFFESVAGVALLVVALTMQAAGVMLVRRMLRVAE